MIPEYGKFKTTLCLACPGGIRLWKLMSSAGLPITPCMAATHIIVPLHLGGNTTEEQNKLLQDCLGDAIQNAYREAIEQLDRQSAKAVLEVNGKLKSEVSSAVIEIIRRHTASDKFAGEEVASNRVFLPPIACGLLKRRQRN